MGENTAIEWADMTWNIITGCDVTSPGCIHCYAMRLAALDPKIRDHASREGLTKMTKAGPVWTGEVRFNDAWLEVPLRKRKPQGIFPCAHGDMFHDAVKVEWLDLIFAVMAMSPQHTFRVLTKRAAGARAYFEGLRGRAKEIAATISKRWPNMLADQVAHVTRALVGWHDRPLPNVWLGVSVEDQARADERLPELLAIPCVLHWASYEPALGPVDWRRVRPLLPHHVEAGFKLDALGGFIVREDGTPVCLANGSLDWIVAGGESEMPQFRDARPSHPEWFRRTLRQVRDTGRAFMLKQWGNWMPKPLAEGEAMEVPAPGDPNVRVVGFDGQYGSLKAPVARMVHVKSKRSAGNLLDGAEYLEFPEPVLPGLGA